VNRILITGGTGFFGKSMLDYRFRHPEQTWPEWIVLSRNPNRFVQEYSTLANQRGVSFIAGDVRGFDAPKGRLDAIIHAAAALNPALGATEIMSATIEGTKHIIDIAKETGCKRVLYTSSGAVYGPTTAPLSEDAPFNPTSPYGQAKVEAEGLLLSSGLDVKIARCFAFVGKYLDRTTYYAIGNFIHDALSGKDIVINGDGSPMRSYMYADDLVEWLFAILERGKSGRPYNVGSPEAISIRDLATLVRDTLGSKSEVNVLGRTVPGAAKYYVPSIDRARRELGLTCKRVFRDALLHSAVKAT